MTSFVRVYYLKHRCIRFCSAIRNGNKGHLHFQPCICLNQGGQTQEEKIPFSLPDRCHAHAYVGMLTRSDVVNVGWALAHADKP